MPSLPESILNTFLGVAVVTTGGIFLAVVLGGLLSALLTLGFLELRARERIQKRVLEGYFDPGAGRSLREFLSKRYSGEEVTSAYADRLLQLHLDHQLVPTLAHMNARSLYRLHYRQICGQLMGVVNNESLRREKATFVVAPLTDMLAFLASRRNEILSLSAVADSQIAPDSDSRSDLDLAMREIDGIQATLGDSISRATYPYVYLGWLVVYGVALFATPSFFALFADLAQSQHFFETLKLALYLNLTVLGVAMLAIGTAVFGLVAFAFLDRFLASK